MTFLVPMSRRRSVLAALTLLACACAPPGAGPAPAPGERLPPIPARSGPLAIDLVYPAEGQTLGTVDSTFIFGSVGTGSASLTVNGAPISVEPNGAFLAFLPVPGDGIYELSATASGETQRLSRQVTLPGPPVATGGIDLLETYHATEPGDSTPLPGAWPGRVRTARADGTAIGTAVAGSGTPYHWFFPNGTRLLVTGRSAGQLRVRLTDDLSVWVDSADVEPVVPAGPGQPVQAALEPVIGPVADEPRDFVGTVAAVAGADFVDVRLTTSSRLPYRVDGDARGLTVTVYGAETRTNNLLYGATDALIDRMEWEQPEDEVYRLHVELKDPLWGFDSFFDAEDRLVVRVRRPPPINAAAPLRGLYIGVDAGHPPGGAIGPTRLTEAEVTLGVSRRLARLLEERGARVLQTRPDTAAVGLGTRPLQATEEGVHLLVSVHIDAFGDGVNPFENHGTHVFYNQAQSLDLARAVQRELLRELGLRDLGVSRRDLALVRPTWMPSILSESAFMMIPRNEAALRDPSVLDRIAAAHLRGIEAFLRARAAAD
jgi:N-acetylmuramoyl-L-alanine amidase